MRARGQTAAAGFLGTAWALLGRVALAFCLLVHHSSELQPVSGWPHRVPVRAPRKKYIELNEDVDEDHVEKSWDDECYHDRLKIQPLHTTIICI